MCIADGELRAIRAVQSDGSQLSGGVSVKCGVQLAGGVLMVVIVWLMVAGRHQYS